MAFSSIKNLLSERFAAKQSKKKAKELEDKLVDRLAGKGSSRLRRIEATAYARGSAGGVTPSGKELEERLAKKSIELDTIHEKRNKIREFIKQGNFKAAREVK